MGIYLSIDEFRTVLRISVSANMIPYNDKNEKLNVLFDITSMLECITIQLKSRDACVRIKMKIYES